MTTNPAFASPWHQERDGIFGEIKYVEVCNYTGRSRIDVIAEAGTRFNRVYYVDFKELTRPIYAGWPQGYYWRQLSRRYNHNSGADRRFYRAGARVVPYHFSPYSEIKFAIHVRHAGGTTIDLGTIVNMGTIPLGRCKRYDDGRLFWS